MGNCMRRCKTSCSSYADVEERDFDETSSPRHDSNAPHPMMPTESNSTPIINQFSPETEESEAEKRRKRLEAIDKRQAKEEKRGLTKPEPDSMRFQRERKEKIEMAEELVRRQGFQNSGPLKWSTK